MLACAYIDQRSELEWKENGQTVFCCSREMREALMLEIGYLHRCGVGCFLVAGRPEAGIGFVELVNCAKELFGADGIKTALVTPRGGPAGENGRAARRLSQMVDWVINVREDAVKPEHLFTASYRGRALPAEYLLLIGKDRDSEAYRSAFGAGMRIHFLNYAASSYVAECDSEARGMKNLLGDVRHAGSSIELEHSVCLRQIGRVHECAHSLEMRGALQPDARRACIGRVKEYYVPILAELYEKLHCLESLIALDDPGLNKLFWKWNALHDEAAQGMIDQKAFGGADPDVEAKRTEAEQKWRQLKRALAKARRAGNKR